MHKESILHKVTFHDKFAQVDKVLHKLQFCIEGHFFTRIKKNAEKKNTKNRLKNKKKKVTERGYGYA